MRLYLIQASVHAGRSPGVPEEIEMAGPSTSAPQVGVPHGIFQLATAPMNKIIYWQNYIGLCSVHIGMSCMRHPLLLSIAHPTLVPTCRKMLSQSQWQAGLEGWTLSRPTSSLMTHACSTGGLIQHAGTVTSSWAILPHPGSGTT